MNTYIPVEEFRLLRYNAVHSVEIQPTFRRNMSGPFSGSENKPSKKLTESVLLATCSMLASCLAHSSTLKIEAICSSETSVDF
jgi:hypothetical protein